MDEYQVPPLLKPTTHQDKVRGETKVHSQALLGSKTVFEDETVIHVDFHHRRRMTPEAGRKMLEQLP